MTTYMEKFYGFTLLYKLTLVENWSVCELKNKQKYSDKHGFT